MLKKKIVASLLTLGTVASGGYLLFIRPWHVRWGATDEEINRSMPGDDEVPLPLMAATRAVTIEARPDEIWPWLVQIGTGRAGWYSYDWIENLMGLRVTSAEQIKPEFQQLKVGDASFHLDASTDTGTITTDFPGVIMTHRKKGAIHSHAGNPFRTKVALSSRSGSIQLYAGSDDHFPT